MLRKVNTHMQKHKIVPLLYNTCENQLKMNWRLKCKTWNCKTARRKHRKQLLDIGFGNDFLDIKAKAQKTKTKIDIWNYIKLKKLLYSKGNLWNGKNICKPFIWYIWNELPKYKNSHNSITKKSFKICKRFE